MAYTMITRRAAIGLLGAVAVIGLAGTPARAAGEIKVLNWKGYGTDEKWALEAFEKKTGIKVSHDYFNSEQEMLTKLRTSPGAYDVVLINNIYVMDAAKEGLIQPIDTSKITNFGDLTPALRDSARFVKDGKQWAVPWVWGLTSFAYNTDKIKERPDSLEALWDPKNAGKVGNLCRTRFQVRVGRPPMLAERGFRGPAFTPGRRRRRRRNARTDV